MVRAKALRREQTLIRVKGMWKPLGSLRAEERKSITPPCWGADLSLGYQDDEGGEMDFIQITTYPSLQLKVPLLVILLAVFRNLTTSAVCAWLVRFL